MISDIDTDLWSKTTRVVVTGGSDIELAWSSPSTASNADQWEQIDLYSVTLPRGAMNMRGSLTQHHACDQRGGCSGTDNTAQQGWTFLDDALNSHTSTAQNLSWGWGSQT